MKKRFKIRKKVHYTFFQAWISTKYLQEMPRAHLLILIYCSKAGYKIYRMETREEKSRINFFKKTALSIPFSGGWIYRSSSRTMMRSRQHQCQNLRTFHFMEYSRLGNRWTLRFSLSVTQCLAFDLSRHAYYLRDIYRREKYRLKLVQNTLVISCLFTRFWCSCVCENIRLQNICFFLKKLSVNTTWL